MRILLLLLACIFLIFTHVYASTADRDDVRDFIEEMSKKHGFNSNELESLFQNVRFSDSIIKAISRPAESLPWYKYKPIFLQSARINSGVRFWRENRQHLQQVEEQYGVPPELIVAVIGVETRYGRTKGNYKVINSLSTLAFDYPKRSKFFRGELEQYLLLTREQGFDPMALEGSYAGAMGIPQFVSSSYRSYAVDFNKDGVIDIWDSPEDAIGSVGNYFKQHGWKAGDLIAVPAEVEGEKYKMIVTNDLKPLHTTDEITGYDIRIAEELSPGKKAKLLVLENRNNNEFWLGFENFYVITRYNHSMLYAMAVFQLAGEIKARYLNGSD